MRNQLTWQDVATPVDVSQINQFAGWSDDGSPEMKGPNFTFDSSTLIFRIQGVDGSLQYDGGNADQGLQIGFENWSTRYEANRIIGIGNGLTITTQHTPPGSTSLSIIPGEDDHLQLSTQGVGAIGIGSSTTITLTAQEEIIIALNAPTNRYLQILGLPTSAAGLPSGTVWLDGDKLSVAP